MKRRIFYISASLAVVVGGIGASAAPSKPDALAMERPARMREAVDYLLTEIEARLGVKRAKRP